MFDKNKTPDPSEANQPEFQSSPEGAARIRRVKCN